MNLRPATMADAVRLFEWRTQTSSTSAFLHDPPKGFADHLRWLTEVLSKPDEHRIFIAMDTQRSAAVGMVRFDRVGPDSAEVSVVVGKDAQRRGAGQFLIQGGIADLPWEVQSVRATVLEENLPSLRLFWSAGFGLVEAKKKGDLKLLYLQKGLDRCVTTTSTSDSGQ